LADHVASALFVFTEESASLADPLQKNSLGVSVTPVAYENVRQNPADVLGGADRVVISGNMAFLKEMVRHSLEHDFSIGLIPLPKQKELSRSMALPDDIDGVIDRALRKNVQATDLILCNEKILFFKASIGRIPLIDRSIQTNRLSILWDGVKKLWSLRLC